MSQPRKDKDEDDESSWSSMLNNMSQRMKAGNDAVISSLPQSDLDDEDKREVRTQQDDEVTLPGLHSDDPKEADNDVNSSFHSETPEASHVSSSFLRKAKSTISTYSRHAVFGNDVASHSEGQTPMKTQCE